MAIPILNYNLLIILQVSRGRDIERPRISIKRWRQRQRLPTFPALSGISTHLPFRFQLVLHDFMWSRYQSLGERSAKIHGEAGTEGEGQQCPRWKRCLCCCEHCNSFRMLSCGHVPCQETAKIFRNPDIHGQDGEEDELRGVQMDSYQTLLLARARPGGTRHLGTLHSSLGSNSMRLGSSWCYKRGVDGLLNILAMCERNWRHRMI